MNLFAYNFVSRARLFVCAFFISICLTACGCGDDGCDASAPTIDEFSADKTDYVVGESARLFVAFSGGEGRIEPSIGPVSSGEFFDTPTLAETTRFKLVVESPDNVLTSRDVTLNVGFRDRWQTLDAAFVAEFHTAVNAADGSVLIIGGDRGQSTLSPDIDRFDPVTYEFTKIGELYSGRARHTATRLGSGSILVVGGEVSLNGAPGAELVDENTGAVSDAGALNQPRVGHAAVLLGDDRVLVVGGARDTLEVWDPATNQWRLVTARMAHVRQYATATLLADDRVLIAGGLGGPDYTFAEIFDPETESLVPVQPSLEQRRYLHSAHLQSDGSVYVVGGEIAGDDIVPQASVLRFDPVAEKFAEVTPLNIARTLVAGITLPGDEIFLVGGQTESDSAIASAVLYSSTGERNAAPMPAPRVWHTVSRLPDGRLLVVGGESDNAQLQASVLIYE